jgi:hypothetical protein
MVIGSRILKGLLYSIVACEHFKPAPSHGVEVPCVFLLLAWAWGKGGTGRDVILQLFQADTKGYFPSRPQVSSVPMGRNGGRNGDSLTCVIYLP